MSDYIESGDYVLSLEKELFPFKIKYHRGDVVVFKKEDITFVKRIAAISSDTVKGKLYELNIDAENYPVDEVFFSISGDDYNSDQERWNLYIQFLFKRTSGITAEELEKLAGENYFIIPDNYYFLIGDNYYESMDSRFWGFINEDQIIGKVIAVF